LSYAATTLPLRAATAFSAGVMAIAAGDYEAARAALEDAADLFERSATPYEAARARLELASVLVSLDRLERARVEAGKAKEALERLGSRFHARRAAALIADIARRASGRRDGAPALTERQLEILRLISQGKSDRDIAAALGVSEHTVHRHVANILLRLDLPTRAAAAAFSASRGFI
jgi:LuxR family maltose regulon positive regulatory protein